MAFTPEQLRDLEDRVAAAPKLPAGGMAVQFPRTVGFQGSTGAQGVQGKQGSQGSPGTDPGPPGGQGFQGPQGLGTQGAQGRQGTAGPGSWNIDGGEPDSIYGGIPVADGGSP